MSSNNNDKRPFFVGYSNMPAPLEKFYKRIAIVLIALAILMAVWVSVFQKSTGEGTVDLVEMTTITGYLTIDPYPILHFKDENQAPVILVDRFKKSANHLVGNFDQKWITVSGLMVQRGDWYMLQLPPDIEVQVDEQNETLEVTSIDHGEVTLTGEIIDSKCFLGAMKPGGGKVHRACARLCLLGGIPPMFVAKNSAGSRVGYLIENSDGSSASLTLADEVAIPVSISGNLRQKGNIQFISFNPESVKPLTSNALVDYGTTLEEESLAMHAHH